MCLAVPARIIEIENEMATVDLDGVTRKVSLMLVPDLQVGDYVITHAGFALHKVEEEDAAASMSLLRQLVDAAG